jgi:hypothetical protein
MSVFDTLIKGVPAEDRAVLDKYPDLMNTMNALEEGGAKYSTWYANNWDREHDMTKSEYAARQEAEELRLKLEAAPPNPVNEIATTDIQKMIDDRLKAQAEEFNRTISGMDNFYSAAHKLGFAHKDEFGKPLDDRKLLEFMGKNHIQDPTLAYERMVAADRATIAATKQQELEAQHLKDVQEAEERGANRVRQEVTMGVGGMLPTDDAGGIVGVTHIAPSGTVPKDLLDQTAGMKLTDPRLAVAGLKAAREGLLQ